MSEEEFASIQEDLASLIERLDSYTYDVLAQASHEGETERPDLDRQLVRVRRALERAIAIMRPLS